MNPSDVFRRLHDALATDGEILDPGDTGEIIVDRTLGYVSIVTAGAETRTLADPVNAGVYVTIAMQTDGGDCVITADSAVNQTGNNTITLNDAGDTVVLTSIKSGSDVVWRVVENDGASLSTV